MRLSLQRYNERVESWTSQALSGLKATGDSLSIQHRKNSPSRGASLAKLAAKTHLDGGAADRVGFRINRSLIYTHKGAGRGQGGVVGSTWYNKLGELKTTNPGSKGAANNPAFGKRTAKPWFNRFIESADGVDELASIAAEELGDAIVNKMLIK